MGSGINSSAQGKYVGNATEQEIKPGFKPKVVKIRSAAGEVVFHEGMPNAWKQTDTAVPAFVAGVEFTEFGFKVSGTDAAINANAANYYYEAY